MIPAFVFAADITPTVEVGGAAVALEFGGLLFMGIGVISILLGLFNRNDESGGGLSVSYGIAITLAAGLSLYLSTFLGGDPLATALESTWIYPLLTIIACMLYISHSITQSTKGHNKESYRARGAAVDEMVSKAANRSVRGDYRTSGRPVRRGGRRPVNPRSTRSQHHHV